MRLNLRQAQVIVENLKEQIKNEVESRKDILATKEDVAKLDVKVTDIKGEIIKWMFIFWIGQQAATFALIKLLH
jgi:hypothetical protein